MIAQIGHCETQAAVKIVLQTGKTAVKTAFAYGGVSVSTGTLSAGKRAAVRNRLKIRKLYKLNNNNYAYAA